jgi:type I restriction enzyme M protein
MLDNITKKNIDDCRDVLVGKVPDPKSQIEQITLALIYKFMDDMDKEAVEKFKGKPKFFIGEFAKYGWRKLFNPSLSGKEILELYSEGLDKLQTNAKIPELFRNIFKNAFLPYKDSATLKMFLKHIDEFEYSHSEKLGDAFEYLLSVMGSQGDAGQFRTPRHIIDFIIACVNPQKNETVADPACGTAGFLLSAYKHILNQNTVKRLGDKLTPDQRRKLSENLKGYDISPDMVRLSLVNMYLHGFTTPQIFEYDTLSSEDRWNEAFDVILANPPFMTPKGGIRPHKKFGVQANKAEVLFTDYIAEHLNKNGRAGIVVPNGIVATTQTAYKQLRKLLVEDSLIAVVSLPAGCFNPYSGVKTSILMLDKGLAKKSKHILFIKISNDGFDLGAQRREIDKNDLPIAQKAFSDYKKNLTKGKPFDPNTYNNLCLLVEKEKILTNKNVVLSGDRYLDKIIGDSNFDYVPLSELFVEIKNGRNVEQFDKVGKYRVSRIQTIADGTVDLNKTKWTNDDIPEKDFLQVGDILLSHINSIEHLAKSAIFKVNNEKVVHGINLLRLKPNGEIVIPEYAAAIFKSDLFLSRAKTFAKKAVNQASISTSDLKTIEIPLPSIEIQEQIVKEIEGYQKIIDGAKMVVENYKPTITINPAWEMVELESLCTIQSGGTPSRTVKEYWDNGTIPWVGSTVCKDCEVDKADEFITELGFKKSNTKLFPIGTTLIALVGATIGKTAFLKFKTTTNQNIAGLQPINEEVLNKIYLFYACQSIYNEFYKLGEGGFSMASLGFVKKLHIPLPSLKEQIQIVNQIEQEQQTVNANKQLLTIFKQKIKDKVNQVWGIKEDAEL